MTEHSCIRTFTTSKIDDCCGIGSNICSGIEGMKLLVWFQDTDHTECYIDNWMEVRVNYCPFCGIKANNCEKV